MLFASSHLITHVLLPCQIDDEFGGRGHAYLDVGHLKIVQVLRRKRDGMTAEEWAAPELQEEAVGELTHALKRNLSRRAVIVYPKLYQSWKAFLKAFTRLGMLAAERVYVCQCSGSPQLNVALSSFSLVQAASLRQQQRMSLAAPLSTSSSHLAAACK